MTKRYRVERRLQEQSGAYLVCLPKIWVERLGLKQGDALRVEFDGEIRILPKRGGTSRACEKERDP